MATEPDPSGPLPWANPGEALACRAALMPDAEAAVYPRQGRRCGFADWHRRSTALAHGLLAAGLRPGDRLALLAENRLEFPVVQLAAALAGLVLVPLNTRDRREELAYKLRLSGARGLLLSPGFAGRDWLAEALALQADGAGLALLAVMLEAPPDGLRSYAELLDGRRRAATLPAVGADDAAALLFTSGTTGHPKAALLTHRAMLTAAWLTARRLEAVPGERWLSMIPLFHCAGVICTVLLPLLAGAAHIGLPTFDAAETCRVIEAERATGFVGVPTGFVALREAARAAGRDLSSLRIGISGGAPPDAAVLRACEAELPCRAIVQVYGLTETGTTVAVCAPDDPLRGETAGPPVDGVEVRIAEVSTGAALPAGAVGEIQVRGPTVLRRYHGDAEASAAAFTADGWFRTGDLGRLDERGYLAVSAGRLKDMLIRGGENLYPVEIERCLQRHFAVAEASVFGLPDAYFGEVPAAAVRLDLPARADDLRVFVADALGRHKAPVRFFAVDGFPMTPSGKIRKPELRDLALAGRLAELA